MKEIFAGFLTVLTFFAIIYFGILVLEALGRWAFSPDSKPSRITWTCPVCSCEDFTEVKEFKYRCLGCNSTFTQEFLHFRTRP